MTEPIASSEVAELRNELADAKAEGEAQERAEAKHALLEDILRELKLQA